MIYYINPFGAMTRVIARQVFHALYRVHLDFGMVGKPFCGTRSRSTFPYLTDEASDVTCKRCLAKIEQQP